MMLVGQRRRLLDYLKSKDMERYRGLIERLASASRPHAPALGSGADLHLTESESLPASSQPPTPARSRTA